MVRKSTKQKYPEINQLLKEGKSIRYIKTHLECSTDTINKAKNYVPEIREQLGTPKPKIRTPISITQTVPNKKGTNRNKKPFDLNMAVILKSIIKKVSKQYWNKSKEDIEDIEKFEEYMTERTGLKFNFVLNRRLMIELTKVNKEMDEFIGVK